MRHLSLGMGAHLSDPPLVSQGLAYLHGISKVHRDIKCSNILLTVSGQVKLADFGVSAQLTRTMSKRNTFIGTPHWMAPEVIQESRYDGKVDVWALGISVMEMAEFQPPRHAIHPMRVIFMISREPPPQLAQAEAWSSAMHSFVAACLQKNARQRPSAAQLLNHSFVKQATAATTCLADEVERTAEWLAAQRSAAADAEGHTGGSTPVAGSAASTGGAAVKVGPLPGAPAATSPLRGADATVSSAGTFVVHDSWDGGAGAAARREGVQAAVAGSETGGTVSTTTSGPGGSTGRASWAAPAAVAVHGAGGGGPVSAPPQGGTQGKGKAPPKAAPAKAAAAAPSGGSSHRSRSRSGERWAVGLTYGTQAAEEAVRQWMEDAWSGLDASAAERILASADGACLVRVALVGVGVALSVALEAHTALLSGATQPFLRACDVPPLALIQADTHGDLAVDVDQEAMAHLAQACACTGAEGTPHPALPDSTQAMLRACPPLLNVARAAAFHAAAAAAAPAVGPARQAHAAAESGLVETLRTVMHL